MTPRENLLLAGLPAADYARLRDRLQCHELPPGPAARATLSAPDRLHFVGKGLLSLVRGGSGRDPIGVALIGPEGAAGLGMLTRGEAAWDRAIEPHTPVRTWSLPAAVARAEFACGGVLQRNLLRFGYALLEQVVATTVCRARHPVDDQVRRWLLAALDRLPGTEIPVTQDGIAAMLGVRRASVTDALGRLQAVGAIARGRGCIRVVDRVRLEADACVCCNSLRTDFEALCRDLATAAAR